MKYKNIKHIMCGFCVVFSIFAGFVWGQVYINEVELNPPEGEGEWIELYNSADGYAYIGGYTVEDNFRTYTIPENTVIEPKKTTVIESSVSMLELNNNGEVIILRDETGTEIDRFEGHNEGTRSAKTYQRIPDGTGDWEKIEPPTKGFPNYVQPSGRTDFPEFPGALMAAIMTIFGVGAASGRRQ